MIHYLAAHPLPAIVFLGAVGFLYGFLSHIIRRPMQSRSDLDNSNDRPKSLMFKRVAGGWVYRTSTLIAFLFACFAAVAAAYSRYGLHILSVPPSGDHAPAASETIAAPKLAPPGGMLVATAPNTWVHDHFGAIAYSPSSGAHGYASDYSSQADAEAHALAECRSKGDGCKSAIWFHNACGALAVGPDGGWGSDWGPDQQTAEQKALDKCKNHSSGCSVVRWVCTTR